MTGNTFSITTAPVESLEAELLLCCARSGEDPERGDRIGALLQKDIEWMQVLRMAHQHGVAPLLFWNLNATYPKAVPQTVMAHLRDHFYNNSRRNLFLTGELLRIINICESHGIPAVPYKGPVLAAFAYGNLALREFADLDLLIHKWDIPKARELLVSLGYKPQDEIPPAHEAAFLRSQREYVFIHDNESIVELHWAVTPRHYSFPLDPECLWERLQQSSLGGRVIPTLSPEDSLLVLCVHGSKHLWVRLGWICDVAELINLNKSIDWDQLMVRAARLGGERMLFLGLLLAHNLLGAVLPHEVLQKVQADPAVRPLAKQVQGWIFREGGASDILRQGREGESRFHPFRVKVRERLRDKVLYCARTALVPTVEDWALFPLPKPLFPLYYVLRPIRLSVRYGQRIKEQTD